MKNREYGSEESECWDQNDLYVEPLTSNCSLQGSGEPVRHVRKCFPLFSLYPVSSDDAVQTHRGAAANPSYHGVSGRLFLRQVAGPLPI